MIFSRRSGETQLITTMHDLAVGLGRRQQLMPSRWISARLLIGFHIIAWQSSSITMVSETRTYPGSKVSLQIGINILSLIGKASSPAAVTSGIPLGTVLQPLLVLLNINDLPYSIRHFADEYLLHRVIRNQKDRKALQTDLNHLQEWERDWQMVFSPDKCEHICITNKRNVIQTSYNIHGQTLKETPKAKYPGVTRDSKLFRNSHTDTVTKRANHTIAFLCRNL